MPKKTPQNFDPELNDTILINGMPFNKDAVLQMPDGAAVWAKGVAENAALKARNVIRNVIKTKVADPQSILGTTADGAQLAIAAILVDIVALENADSFAKYKAGRKALMTKLVGKDRTSGDDIDVAALAGQMLAGLETGDVKLTSVLKGVPVTLAEVFGRSTLVTDILIEASQK